MNTATIISLVISCVMMLVGVATFVITQVRNGKSDIDAENKSKDEMKASLLELNLTTKMINTTTNDIKAEVKSLTTNVNDINTRLVLVEKEQKTMWKKLDSFSEKEAR